VAEAEKAGIEKAGGTAVIYQYVHGCEIPFLMLTITGSRRLSLRRF
jgi:hypothetical protein